jgi:hypothetical protein
VIMVMIMKKGRKRQRRKKEETYETRVKFSLRLYVRLPIVTELKIGVAWRISAPNSTEAVTKSN